MKKTVNVNIASQPFTLDQDAYEALESYLDDIAMRLPASDSGSMENIEARIARLFASLTKAGHRIMSLPEIDRVKDEIGLPESFGRRRDEAQHHRRTEEPTVEYVVEESIASPQQQPAPPKPQHIAAQPVVVVTEESAVTPAQATLTPALRPQEPEQQPYDYPTHLYRSRDERMLAGVCGGLSKYINCPVGTVRAVTVVLVLPALLSVFAYFILWYLLPEEPLYDKNGNVIDTNAPQER